MGNRQETGELLRQAREAKELTLEVCQAKTKIHIAVLRALERGELPSGINPVYLRGFLKIYSHLLGLEAQKIIAGFGLDLPVVEKPIKPVKNERAHKREFNGSPSLAIDPERSRRVNILLSQDRLRQIQRLLFPLLGILFLVFLVGRIASCRRQHRAVAVKETPAVTAAPAPVSNIPKLSIRAKESSWLRVRADGKTVFQGMFRRGLSETWSAKERIELSLGNAGAVELEVNGKVMPALGKRGQAVKSVKITKEGLIVGK
ncbi:MAG: helix-turn-helix domain-containing protein [Candidatus Omnitrophota bacterium]